MEINHGQQHPILAVKIALALGIWLTVYFLSGCTPAGGTSLPTPIPSELIPTIIAQTMQARLAELPAHTPEPSQQEKAMPSASASSTSTTSSTPKPTDQPQTSTPTPGGSTSTPTRRVPSATMTPTQDYPFAEVEIRNLGPFSKVTSPIFVVTYLKPGAGGKFKIELFGENKRLLYRNIRVVDFVPVGAWALLSLDIKYEILAAGEAGRLVLSVDDNFGRTVALNSVPLILLSIGEADIVPPRDVLAPIIIQQPRRKAVLQGGTVFVTGLARPNGDQPIHVRLLTDKGAEVGARLGTIGSPGELGYGAFSVDVPYTVTKPTTVLMVVTIGGDEISDIIHLSSRELILSP